MLEARIYQLQSPDVIRDGEHSKVVFVKNLSKGRGALSGKGSKSIPREKTDIPKSGQIVSKGASKSQPIRWMKKITEEKKNKLMKQLQFQQKNEHEKPAAQSKSTKSSSVLPGTSHKTISTVAKKKLSLNKKSKVQLASSVESCAAVSSTSIVASDTPGIAVMPHKASKGREKHSKKQISSEDALNDAEALAKELAEVEELERKLSQQVNKWKYSGGPERLQEETEGTACRDIHLSIRSYLEACVFAGDIDRAHRFLRSQHRVMSRRRQMNTDVYNIMMRLWAKKVSCNLKNDWLLQENFHNLIIMKISIIFFIKRTLILSVTY